VPRMSADPNAVTTRRPGLIEACDDAALFNFALSPRQRRLLEAVERGPRVQVWSIGRRSGKSTLGALIGLHDCLFRDLSEKVREGEEPLA
jgi:hypothetical protein